MGRLDIYSMFLLGLLGTGHCLGMCGPLIFAIPAATGRFSSHLFYHLGRVITYSGVGVIMGGIGACLSYLALKSGIEPLAWIGRIQVGFSLFAALFLLVFGLSRLGLLAEPEWMSIASPSGIPGYRGVLKRAVNRKSDSGIFVLGLMMGFLPCGLSFAAFSRALPAGGPLEGGILVAAFAAGTLPGLLLLGTGASRVLARYRQYSDILSGVVMIGMATSMLTDILQAIVRF